MLLAPSSTDRGEPHLAETLDTRWHSIALLLSKRSLNLVVCICPSTACPYLFAVHSPCVGTPPDTPHTQNGSFPHRRRSTFSAKLWTQKHLCSPHLTIHSQHQTHARGVPNPTPVSTQPLSQQPSTLIQRPTVVAPTPLISTRDPSGCPTVDSADRPSICVPRHLPLIPHSPSRPPTPLHPTPWP